MGNCEDNVLLGKYNFNNGWKFKIANNFPLQEALDTMHDFDDHKFFERDFDDSDWESVCAPHTFNDGDLFVNRIKDAGSGQLRTFSFYRKWFDAGVVKDRKFFLEFEGIRQTCYLYVNGKLASYYEAGAFPVGFDITDYLVDEPLQLVAIATDNTSTRDMDYFSAETPNDEDAVPGNFIHSLTKEMMPGYNRGVYYEWNCNDFNPVIGGLSRNVYLHVKPLVYLTLPLYSNLKTKGSYVYASSIDTEKLSAQINVLSEVRNETTVDVSAHLQINAYDMKNRKVLSFEGEKATVPAHNKCPGFRTIIPKRAYDKVKKDDGWEYIPKTEEAFGNIDTDSYKISLIEAKGMMDRICLWDVEYPYLYTIEINLMIGQEVVDSYKICFGIRKTEYVPSEGLKINGRSVWLRGYAQRSTNEWAAIGCATDYLKDIDARLIRESNANHIRFMHTAGSPADIRSYNRFGIVCTQPAGDKEREYFDRMWKMRVELMRDIIIYFRNEPCILFWEAGNNSISKEHMKEMRLLKEELDPHGGRFMGCRTINTMDVVEEAEYVGTMLNRHAASFIAGKVPVTETEYLREEAPRRVWDDYTPPYYDYDNRWVGKIGRKQDGFDFYDLTSEDLALCAAKGYEEFFNDRVKGASGKNLYCATAALCWTDSAQHGRQTASENARMSGRVDPVRIKKQNFDVFRVMQSEKPDIVIVGHWNYPPVNENNYLYAVKEFDGHEWIKTGDKAYRDPCNKTVYVVGSYHIARIDLYVNGEFIDSCSKPESTFIFVFKYIDISKNGYIEALGYDYEGNRVAKHIIRTAFEPNDIKMTLTKGPKGFLADGNDIAFIDVEVVDVNENVCPLCADRITFETQGAAVFLGGYNSGRFKYGDKDDSVIHKSYVYAECGVNRVFLRSLKEAGNIAVTATMMVNGRIVQSKLEFESVPTDISGLTNIMPQCMIQELPATMPIFTDMFSPIRMADECKYIKKEGVFCKVLVNGQEPNTNGFLSKVEHSSVYSPILFILEAMKRDRPAAFDYIYENNELTIISGENKVITAVGHTHMNVNDEENLLNAQPYENEDGILYVEINAVISYIQGVSAKYDELSNLFRIEW